MIGDSEPTETMAADEDSGIASNAVTDPTLLTFVQDGRRAIVGFNSTAIPDEVCVAAYKNQLLAYVQEHDCKIMAFNLAGVKMLPSGMLGLLVSLKKKGLEVELLRPSADILEVLRITKLVSILKIDPAS